MRGGGLLVAMDLAIPVVERIEVVMEEVSEEVVGEAQVRWRRAEEIRLGLKWLGEVDGAMVEVVVERLREFAQPLFPFQVVSRGLISVGPAWGGVSWIGAGMDGRGAELVGLVQQTLERELMRAGVEADERTYVASAWLGRVRGGGAAIERAVASRSDVLFGSSTIKDLYLLKVDPGGEAGAGRVIERVALGAQK
jgi:2'-5' RNA ligase